MADEIFSVTATPLPKLLIRSPLAPDCNFELRVGRDPTSEEWDALFEYLAICRRGADRKRQREGSIPGNPGQPERTPGGAEASSLEAPRAVGIEPGDVG
jgi:hypothetical protein